MTRNKNSNVLNNAAVTPSQVIVCITALQFVKGMTEGRANWNVTLSLFVLLANLSPVMGIIECTVNPVKTLWMVCKLRYSLFLYRKSLGQYIDEIYLCHATAGEHLHIIWEGGESVPSPHLETKLKKSPKYEKKKHILCYKQSRCIAQSVNSLHRWESNDLSTCYKIRELADSG